MIFISGSNGSILNSAANWGMSCINPLAPFGLIAFGSFRDSALMICCTSNGLRFRFFA
ncbi:hypothetical protein D3C76_1454110 [compost metagenome]